MSDASDTFVTTHKISWLHNSEEYDLIFTDIEYLKPRSFQYHRVQIIQHQEMPRSYEM
jgi:hypothetical protein